MTIKKVDETRHRVVAGELSEPLDDLLADEGRLLLADRLRPAVRPGRYDDVSQSGRPDAFRRPSPRRCSLRERVLAGDVAMVEFEITVGRKQVDRIDIIRPDEAGRILEFRGMTRRPCRPSTPSTGR